MATISTALVNSPFIGSPVIIVVTAGQPANATFHRVRLKVDMPSGSSSPVTMEFSTPVNSGQQVNFDISSALRAFADRHEYTATGLNNYPNVSAALTAYDDYMVDGQEHPGVTSGNNTATISGLYAAALTDMERLTGTRPASYSRKPTSSPEIAFTGMTALVPGALVSGITPQAPSVSAVAVSSGSNANNIYGIPAPKDGYELRFINSLGVHENIFVRGFPAVGAAIATDRYVIARQETLSQFSRGVAIKQNNHETWKMAAGPYDRQWARWFVHEVLMARWAWLGIGVNYIPCHILPDDSTTIFDSAKAEAITIPFNVELDIEGSPV